MEYLKFVGYDEYGRRKCKWIIKFDIWIFNFFLIVFASNDRCFIFAEIMVGLSSVVELNQLEARELNNGWSTYL